MKFERQASIRDLNSAPEAPDALTLSEVSPMSSSRPPSPATSLGGRIVRSALVRSPSITLPFSSKSSSNPTSPASIKNTTTSTTTSTASTALPKLENQSSDDSDDGVLYGKGNNNATAVAASSSRDEQGVVIDDLSFSSFEDTPAKFFNDDEDDEEDQKDLKSLKSFSGNSSGSSRLKSSSSSHGRATLATAADDMFGGNQDDSQFDNEFYDDDDDYTQGTDDGASSRRKKSRRANAATLRNSRSNSFIANTLTTNITCCCRSKGGGDNGAAYNRLSSFVVRNAPCFWCCGNRLEVGATDRSILYRLNILSGFFALGQSFSAVLLVILFYSDLIVERDDESVNRSESGSLTPNLWNLNGSVFLVGIVGAGIFITMIVTLKVIREVNLRGAIRYMWIMVWMLPLEFFLVISLFDYHRVTEVWVRHWWSLPTLAYFRSLFCAEGTANTLCIVPVDGGLQYENETVWCMENYNASNCTQIRDDAQSGMLFFSYLFYNINGVWGVLLISLLILTVNVLEGIITKPIVQKSRESNVPAWLTLPIVGCATVGSIFLFSPSSAIGGIRSTSGSENAWIGVLYIVCGVTFFVGALLGWFISSFSILNSRDKRNKNLAVLCFIALMGATTLLVGTIFAGSILQSTSLINVPLTDDVRGRVACEIDSAMSCSICSNSDEDCPEWTSREVTKVLQTQLKQGATLAAIFFMYAIGALRFGFVLKKHISKYQIDYV